MPMILCLRCSLMTRRRTAKSKNGDFSVCISNTRVEQYFVAQRSFCWLSSWCVFYALTDIRFSISIANAGDWLSVRFICLYSTRNLSLVGWLTVRQRSCPIAFRKPNMSFDVTVDYYCSNISVTLNRRYIIIRMHQWLFSKKTAVRLTCVLYRVTDLIVIMNNCWWPDVYKHSS